jgi:hypothetical protein
MPDIFPPLRSAIRNRSLATANLTATADFVRPIIRPISWSVWPSRRECSFAAKPSANYLADALKIGRPQAALEGIGWRIASMSCSDDLRIELPRSTVGEKAHWQQRLCA